MKQTQTPQSTPANPDTLAQPDPSKTPAERKAAPQPPTPAQDTSTLPPLALATGQPPPPLPPELATGLSPRDLALILSLTSGLTWDQAQTQARIRTRARLKAPPDRIRKAAEWQVKAMVMRCGLSRDWITSQLVQLYGRAAGLSDITLLNRSGVMVTGRHWDGATARACLELLGGDLGMWSSKRAGGDQLPVDTVAALLQAVAARGKPALPGDSARVITAAQHEPQVIESNSGASQHGSTPEP